MGHCDNFGKAARTREVVMLALAGRGACAGQSGTACMQCIETYTSHAAEPHGLGRAPQEGRRSGGGGWTSPFTCGVGLKNSTRASLLSDNSNVLTTFETI
jgi:hypothetical protein